VFLVHHGLRSSGFDDAAYEQSPSTFASRPEPFVELRVVGSEISDAKPSMIVTGRIANLIDPVFFPLVYPV
jgi:hypothetical protein